MALELVSLLDAAKRYKYYLVIRLLALTGARLGEILGLQWTDIDFKKGTLTIQRSADSRNRVLEDDTKTEASPRTIRLDDDSLALLAAFKDEHRVVGPKDSYLIFNYEGRVVREDAIRRTMNYALKKAGLTHKRIHDLRHGAGSLLLDGGQSLAAVSAFLGHSSTAITPVGRGTQSGRGPVSPGFCPSQTKCQTNKEKPNKIKASRILITYGGLDRVPQGLRGSCHRKNPLGRCGDPQISFWRNEFSMARDALKAAAKEAAARVAKVRS